jgi:hypothetical protein
MDSWQTNVSASTTPTGSTHPTRVASRREQVDNENSKGSGVLFELYANELRCRPTKFNKNYYVSTDF